LVVFARYRASVLAVPAPPIASTTTAAVRFDAVDKVFADGTRALTPIDLSIAGGELVAIVGPSGCGKSTLLRITAGLESPTSGTVTTASDRVGYVFQDPTLLPWRTVQRNVELPAELHGVAKAERRARAADAIALTGLRGFERHRPRALSGGMRMRVSLARALTMRPSIFLFDEPFAALDEITRQRLNDELLAIFTEQRFAGAFVTHSVAEAVYLSTRVVVMSARPGRIVADIPVPFGLPRAPDLRYSPEFAAIAGEVSHHLREVSA
jgi:NitT/TauT family transport system ATP-binding protein